MLSLFQKENWVTSPAVQWLGLCPSTARGTGSIPGQGTKIPHATWQCSQKKKKKVKLSFASFVSVLPRDPHFFKTVGEGAMWERRWVEGWNLLTEIFFNNIFSQRSNVTHTKEPNWSPPWLWLPETAGAAPKLCCLLKVFDQTCLCYLGFLCWQQKLPSGSVSFNQLYRAISSVCSGRKPGQSYKVYRLSKNFNNCFFS